MMLLLFPLVLAYMNAADDDCRRGPSLMYSCRQASSSPAVFDLRAVSLRSLIEQSDEERARALDR